MFDWLALLSEYHVALALLILGLPIMLLFGWSTIRAKAEARHRERILDTRTWDQIIAGLQPGWADRYFGAISASTGWFDRVYGPRLLGWRAFDRAFGFALAYAVLTLLIGLVVFDAGNLGGWGSCLRGGRCCSEGDFCGLDCRCRFQFRCCSHCRWQCRCSCRCRFFCLPDIPIFHVQFQCS